MNIKVLRPVANHPHFRQLVTEITWDDECKDNIHGRRRQNDRDVNRHDHMGRQQQVDAHMPHVEYVTIRVFHYRTQYPVPLGWQIARD
ncbi:hypothetical protein AlacWU_09850 [Aspergillus niger]|nr:hypothetical protein AlacWU_09850 [Aspergillus niger]